MIEKIVAISKSGVMVNLDNVISIKSDDRVVNKYIAGISTVKHEIHNEGHIIELLPKSKIMEELTKEVEAISNIEYVINTIKFENSGDEVIFIFKIYNMNMRNELIERKDLGERIYYNQSIMQLYCKKIDNITN